MQTERVTFLTTPDHKASLAARASARGISVGEYVRRKTEDEEEMTAEQEAELTALIAQVNLAIPKMATSLDRMSERLRATHEEIDHALREAGIRR